MSKRCRIPKDSILKRIQGYFRLLCASSSEYYYVQDIKANLMMLSPNMVADFGLPAEVVTDIEAVWLPVIHPDDVEGFLKELHKNYTPEDNVHDAFYRVRDIKGNYIFIA